MDSVFKYLNGFLGGLFALLTALLPVTILFQVLTGTGVFGLDVRTWNRIVTGSRAVKSANNPPRNPFKYLNTESIVISPIYKFCDRIVIGVL
jgi:hypothetical protein